MKTSTAETGTRPEARQIIAAVKRKRIREEAIEQLRKRTKRNIFSAVCSFTVAVLWFVLAAKDGVSHVIAGQNVLLVRGACEVVGATIAVMVGLLHLWVNPSDRLLVALVEESLMKDEGSLPSG